MERSLIESFVHPSTGHAPSFDFMLNTYLTKYANFRPNNYHHYFLNFFLGFVFMIPETTLEEDLGVKRAYVKFMPENVGLKFIFVLDGTADRVPSIEVRNVFFVSMGKHSRFGLSAEEYKRIKDNMWASKSIDIDAYKANLEEYLIVKSNTYKNEEGYISNQKLDIVVEKLRVNQRMVHRVLEENTNANTGIRVMQRAAMGDVIYESDWPKPLEHHLNALLMSQDDEEGYKGKINHFFSTLVDVYKMTSIIYGINYQQWSGADCGFVHGSLLALSHKLGAFGPISMIHDFQIGLIHHQYNAEMSSNGMIGRFYLLINTRIDKKSGESGLLRGKRNPMVLSFTRDHINNAEAYSHEWITLLDLSSQNSWHEQTIIVSLSFKSFQNSVSTVSISRSGQISEQEDRSLLLKNLKTCYTELLVNKNADLEAWLEDYLQSKLNSALTTWTTHDIDKWNYVSRYMLGELVWMIGHHTNPNMNVHILHEAKTSEETIFFIESGTDDAKIILKLVETPMKATEDELYSHEEPHSQLNPINLIPDGKDTLVITVEQNFQHSRDAFAHADENTKDFINRKVTISYTKSLEYLKGLSSNIDGIKPIESFNLISRLSNDVSSDNFETSKVYIQEMFKKYAFLIRSKHEFSAFIKGLFSITKHLGTVVNLRPIYSSDQIALLLNEEPNEVVVHQESPLETKRLVIMNFMYSKDVVQEQRSKDALWMIRKDLNWLTMKTDYINVGLFELSEEVHVEHMTHDTEYEGCLTRKKRSISSLCNLKEQKSVMDTEVYNEVPKAKLVLGNLGKISNYVISGIMLRDFISDIIRGDVAGAVKDGSFVIGSLAAEKVANLADSFGSKLLSDGKLFLGNSFKAVAPVLRRVASAFVITHLVSSIKAYQKNRNDTSALVNIGVDSAFLGIDALETGVEVMELFGVIEGVSSVTGPIGMIIGAILIVGANIYETVKKMEILHKQIHLTTMEDIEETFRAFLHLDVSRNIENFIDEHRANQFLMNKVVQNLQKLSSIKYYIGPSGTLTKANVKINEDSIIDLRTTSSFINSRSNPQDFKNFKIFCHLAENAANFQATSHHIEKQKTFWEKISSGFNNFVMSVKTMIDYLRGDFKSLVQDVTGVDPDSMISSYLCHNSFGVVNEESLSEVAVYELGSGFDQVHGFPEKENIFTLNGGHKVVFGGSDKDKFILSGNNRIIGTLNGHSGYNMLDMSQWLHGTPLHINNDTISYQFGTTNQTTSLLISNMSEIIGRINSQEIINCSAELIKINSNGGSDFSSMDTIQIQNDSSANLTITISSFTNVQNEALFGNFTYILNPNVNVVHISVWSNNSSQINHKILFMNPIVNFTTFSIKDNRPTNGSLDVNMKTKSGSTISISIFGSNSNSVRIAFMDGTEVFIKKGHIIAILKTDMKLHEIAEYYDSFLHLTGITMVAYSNSEAKTVTFNHGKYNKENLTNDHMALSVLHNDPVHESRIVCASHVKNIILIRKSLSVVDLGRFYLPTITLDCINPISSDIVIDFSPLSKEISEKWPNLDLVIEPQANHPQSNDVSLFLSLWNDIEDRLEKFIGKVILSQALKNNRFMNYNVINYGLNVIKVDEVPNLYILNNMTKKDSVRNGTEIVHKLNNPKKHYVYHADVPSNFTVSLQAMPLEIDSATSLIILSTYNVEHGQVIGIAKNLTNYEFYQLNDTLIMTNLNDNLMLWDVENSFTIVLENFFSAFKLWTLKFKFENEVSIDFDMQSVKEALNECSGIDKLWSQIIMNDNYFYTH